MNKMFTATAIMQLAERGRLNLSDPISKFIDTTWLSKIVADKITIHQLLSHSSGLGDFFGDKYYATPRDSLRKLSAYKPFIKGSSLAFEPGTGWQYSNSGMILLGAAIEKVSGIKYFDYVRKYIYQPAGMTATDVYDINKLPARIAYGYIRQPDGTYHNNNKFSEIIGSSAGGGYSTVTDLHKFALALFSGKLISDSSRALMLSGKQNKNYGYGFQLQQSSSGTIIGHSGGAPGLNGLLYCIPENDYHIVVLANYDRGAQRLGDYILRLVLENEISN